MDIKELIKNITYPYLPARIRYPYIFWKYYKFLNESKRWDYTRLKEYQWNQLKKLINFAYENTAYYKRKFAEHGITPQNIKDFDDFSQKVPLLTKNDIKTNLNEMIALPKHKLEYVTTGGTTGIPLGFYIEKRKTYPATFAFEWRQFNEGGYYFGDKVAILRGRIIKNNWFEYDKKDNALYLSVFDMTEDNLPKYIKMLKEFKPKHIRAYPSAIEHLAKFISEYDEHFNDAGWLVSIFTSSETLYDYQRIIIEQAFKCPVFNKYGNSEQCTIIGQCKEMFHHEYMEYSYTEYVRTQNCNDSKNHYNLISTSFVNYATPFIRYVTDDIVEMKDKTHEQCSCGMWHRKVKKIIGRTQDYLIAKNDEKISVAAINTHSDAFDNVMQFRYVQKTKGQAIIEIIKGEHYTETDEAKIINEATFRTKGKITFEIKYVDDIPLTQSGKKTFIVNMIERNNG